MSLSIFPFCPFCWQNETVKCYFANFTVSFCQQNGQNEKIDKDIFHSAHSASLLTLLFHSAHSASLLTLPFRSAHSASLLTLPFRSAHSASLLTLPFGSAHSASLLTLPRQDAGNYSLEDEKRTGKPLPSVSEALNAVHQENISVKCIPRHTPLLYSKTGVRGGIPIYLIFVPKHRLWVLVRTASARRF